MTNPSEEKASAGDRKRVQRLRQMLRSAGYVRNRPGFWTPDAVGVRSETVPDDDDENENDEDE